MAPGGLYTTIITTIPSDTFTLTRGVTTGGGITTTGGTIGIGTKCGGDDWGNREWAIASTGPGDCGERAVLTGTGAEARVPPRMPLSQQSNKEGMI